MDASSSLASPGSPLLQVHDLDVRLGDALVLRGVSLRLAPGELVAVVGASGSGKTSLLRAVAGLIGDCGGIRLRGRGPEESGWPEYRRHVVLVSQLPVLLEASVRENLARPFGYTHAGRQFDEAAARALLTDLELESVPDEKLATQLSVGQQQRVALIRALLLAPDVLLLDEPTSALDEESERLVEEAVIRQAARDGLAALVVTHNRAQANRWCHRTIELKEFMPGDAVGKPPDEPGRPADPAPMRPDDEGGVS